MKASFRRELPVLAAIFFFWFSMYTYPSFFSAYVSDRLMAPEVMTGLIVGSYGFAQMVLPIPLGIASDWTRRRKPFVVLGFCASLLACAGLMLTESLAARGQVGTFTHVVALLARGLSGVTAATWVSFSVLYSASYEADEIAPAVSRLMVPQYGSQIVAMLLGAQLAQRVHETAAFALAAFAALAGLVLMRRVPDRPPEEERLTLKSFAAVLNDRGLKIGTLLGTLFRLVCWGTVLGFVPNWARDVAGFCRFAAGLSFGDVPLAQHRHGAFERGVSGAALRLSQSARGGVRHRRRGLLPLPARHGVLGASGGAGTVRRGHGADFAPDALRRHPQHPRPPARAAMGGVSRPCTAWACSSGPWPRGGIISALPTAAEGMAANFYANGALSLLGAGLTLLLLRRGD